MNGTLSFCILLIISLPIIHSARKSNRSSKTSATRPTFQDLLKESTFVDKTMLIKEFVDTSDYYSSTYNLITSPRKFGKSVNLDMLKRFFQLNFNSKGELVDKKSTANYRLFTQPTPKLRITHDAAFMEQYFGEYAVIHVEFSDLGNCTDQDAILNIGRSVQQAYIPYEPLIKLKKDDNRTEFMMKVINGEVLNDEECLTRALQILATFIRDFFGKRVILLIDDFEKPLINVQHTSQHLFRVFRLMDSMYYTLLKQDPPIIDFALLTGILSMARAHLTTKVDNIKRCPFLSEHRFNQYYGFTEEELQELSERMKLKQYELSQVKEYYQCYYTFWKFTPIYNTWDIVQYCKLKKLQPYWLSTDTVLKNRVFDSKDLSQLVRWKRGVNMGELGETKIMLQHFVYMTQHNLCLVKAYFGYLFEHGYLTYVKSSAKTRHLSTFTNNMIYGVFSKQTKLDL